MGFTCPLAAEVFVQSRCYVLWERAECVYLVLGFSLARHLRSHFPFQVTGFDLSHLVSAVNALGTILRTCWFSLPLPTSWLLRPCAFSPDHLPQVLSLVSCVTIIQRQSCAPRSCLQGQGSELSWVTSVFISRLLTPFLFFLPILWFIDHFLQASSRAHAQMCLQLTFYPLHPVPSPAYLPMASLFSDSPLVNRSSPASVSHSYMILPGCSRIRPVWFLWGQCSNTHSS